MVITLFPKILLLLLFQPTDPIFSPRCPQITELTWSRLKFHVIFQRPNGVFDKVTKFQLLQNSSVEGMLVHVFPEITSP